MYCLHEGSSAALEIAPTLYNTYVNRSLDDRLMTKAYRQLQRRHTAKCTLAALRERSAMSLSIQRQSESFPPNR